MLRTLRLASPDFSHLPTMIMTQIRVAMRGDATVDLIECWTISMVVMVMIVLTIMMQMMMPSVRQSSAMRMTMDQILAEWSRNRIQTSNQVTSRAPPPLRIEKVRTLGSASR